MPTVHTGKLLIRFIKDWASIIRKPKFVPSPPKNYSSDFHCWYGFTDDEPNTVKTIPKIYPHDFAESEEEETTPKWGDITPEDTNFNARIKQNRVKNN